MEVRLVPASLVAALIACDAFRRESRLGRRKAAAQREEKVRRWGPRVLEWIGDRPRSVAAVGAGLKVPSQPPAAMAELELTLHALVGRGELLMAPAPPQRDRTLPEIAYAFWKPEDSDRVEAAPREGWVFLQDLALHYFQTAGPATRDDLAWWLGISFSSARHTIEDLAGTLEEVDIAGHKQAHFMLEEAAAALRSGPVDSSRRVALLPKLDPEACWSREGWPRVVDPDLGFWLSTRGKTARGERPRVVQPVLVGGELAGGWRWDSRARRVELDFIRPQREEVEEEALGHRERLATLLDREIPALTATEERVVPRTPQS